MVPRWISRNSYRLVSRWFVVLVREFAHPKLFYLIEIRINIRETIVSWIYNYYKIYTDRYNAIAILLIFSRSADSWQFINTLSTYFAVFCQLNQNILYQLLVVAQFRYIFKYGRVIAKIGNAVIVKTTFIIDHSVKV